MSEPRSRSVLDIAVMPRGLAAAFLVIDFGFIAYWAITLLDTIPVDYLFKDYDNPILHAWNWSFLPLDLLISASGLTAVIRVKRGESWRSWALISLVLTFCSGLQALSFWALRGDLDPAWWLPNLFLLLYPFVFLGRVGWPAGRMAR
jgi:hypothetical protein